MRSLATVDTVQVRTAGSFTNTPGDVTPLGATFLPIFLSSDFDDDGGTANIGGAIVEGQFVGGIQVDYTSRVTDDETGHALILSAALLADVPDRTPVYCDPPVQSKVAHVYPVDETNAAATQEADVPSGHLWADDRLKEGVTGGQTVLVERTRAVRGPGRLRVVEIPGSPPSSNARFLTPGSLELATAHDPTEDMTGVTFMGATLAAPDGTPILDTTNGTGNLYDLIASLTSGDVGGGGWGDVDGPGGVGGGSW